MLINVYNKYYYCFCMMNNNCDLLSHYFCLYNHHLMKKIGRGKPIFCLYKHVQCPFFLPPPFNAYIICHFRSLILFMHLYMGIDRTICLAKFTNIPRAYRLKGLEIFKIVTSQHTLHSFSEVYRGPALDSHKYRI